MTIKSLADLVTSLAILHIACMAAFTLVIIRVIEKKDEPKK